VGLQLRSEPGEPNYVELVWAVRRVTPIQARWIRMFYGEEVLRALSVQAIESLDTAPAGL
jgi:hypothetical protein